MGVKELRQERRWSQEQLADISGLSLRTVQRVESSNKAGIESLQSLALAFEIDVPTLELELAMDKSSRGWQKRPAWVRALFFGSGQVRMDRRQHLLVERFSAIAGLFLLVVGVFFANGTIAPASAKIPMLLCAALMFLSAYLMSVILRIGNRHAVWSWVEPGDRSD